MQIEAGELVAHDKRDGHLTKECYFSHAHGNYYNEITEGSFCELDEIYAETVDRLIASASGRTLVVPLSGGYDSRSIVCALKKANHSNVVCYTYGASNSYEIRIARQVATTLGYPIHVVIYDRAKWQSVVESSRFLDFCRYASHDCAVPHIQELLAHEELRKDASLPGNSVIVPGFCGDVLGGSKVPDTFTHNGSNAFLGEDIADHIYRGGFELFTRTLDRDIQQSIIDRIKAYTSNFRTDDFDDFCSVLEDWITRNRLAKFIVNAVRTYEWFGYEWRLPLWDNSLMEWWYRVPMRHRMHSTLYHRYLFERMFTPLKVDLKQPTQGHGRKGTSVMKYPLHAARLMRDEIKRCLPRRVLDLARMVRSHTLDRVIREDRNGFDAVSTILLKQMRGYYAREEFTFVNGVIAAWLLHQDRIDKRDTPGEKPLGVVSSRCKK